MRPNLNKASLFHEINSKYKPWRRGERESEGERGGKGKGSIEERGEEWRGGKGREREGQRGEGKVEQVRERKLTGKCIYVCLCVCVFSFQLPFFLMFTDEHITFGTGNNYLSYIRSSVCH